MRLSNTVLPFLSIVAFATLQASAGDLPGTSGETKVRPDTAARAGSNVAAEKRPDLWRYRWMNNHWWYWTTQNRWMVYNDQNHWVYPDAVRGNTPACGSPATAPQVVVPGSSLYFGPGRNYNPKLGAFGYSPSDL